jgi:hypothetical protein
LTGLAYWLIQEKREAELRQEVLAGQAAAVRRYGPPFEGLRKKVEKLVTGESRTYKGDFRDPIFRVANLPDGQGIYVRLPLGDAADAERIERGSRRQHTDAVTGCLGVNGHLFGQLLEDGKILDRTYKQKIQRARSQGRLRALDADMVVRIRRDLPNLADHLGPDWLLAVLDEPGGRRPPKRAVIWDLHRSRLLLRVRLETADDVIPVRWVGKGAIPSREPPDRTVRNTAMDCSIGTAIRGLTGEPLPGFEAGETR